MRAIECCGFQRNRPSALGQQAVELTTMVSANEILPVGRGSRNFTRQGMKPLFVRHGDVIHR